MRILHRRDDHARAGAARSQSCADRRRNPAAHDAESVPLRYSHADSSRGAPRGASDEEREERAKRQRDGQMSATDNLGTTLSRRGFLITSGSLVVGFSLGRVSDLFAQRAQGGPKLPGSLAPTPMLDAWIRI